MNLRQLEYFVAVAEELHFGRAAERTFVAQPALSRSIKGLEEELGATLLRRTKRKVELTDEGKFLLSEARALLQRAAKAEQTVRRMALGEAGFLRVSFVGPASQSAFPEALLEFRRTCPDIRLELLERSTAAQLRDLRAGEVHVGLIRSYQHELADVDSLVFSREPYIVALPQDHPLTAESAISMEMFDGLEWIHFPRAMQPRLHDDLGRAFAAAGVAVHLVQEATTKQAAAALVAAGMGAALVPESMRLYQRAGVVYRPLADPEALPCVELKLVWRRAEHPAVAAFVATLQGYCRTEADLKSM